MSRQARINVLLILICLLFGGGLVSAMTTRDAPGETTVAISDPDPVVTRKVRFNPPSAGSFVALTERPLFSESRRRAERARPAVQTAPPPDLRITGFIAIGGTPRALVQINGAPAEMVRMNSAVESWRVSDIGDTTLTLKKGDRSATYELGEEPARQVRAPAAAGPSDQSGQSPVPSFDMTEQIDD